MQLLQQPIRHLRGVGPRKAEKYEKLGVFTLQDLLQLYPRTYEDWSSPLSIGAAPLELPCCICATVIEIPREHFVRKNMTLYRFRVGDGVHMMQVTLFNAAYTAKQLQVGQPYLFFGVLHRKGKWLEMTAPLIEKAEKGAYIRPIYPQTAGLSSKAIEKDIKELFTLYDNTLEEEWLPSDMRQTYSLCSSRFAYQNIHFPKNGDALSVAKKRLIFEELFLFQLGLSQLKRRSRAQTAAKIVDDHTEAFTRLLPFSLTTAQKNAIADGIADMKKDCPMCRLIQGDVGSGKTAVAAALAFSAAENQLQVAFMAPTDILARQHFQSLQKLLGQHLHIALLTASMPAPEKRRVLQQLAEGAVDMVIGTHALVSKKVVFRNLGLVITDEQHRFGVAQRAALTEKGNHPHLLVMSATPIPRTLALLVYGDLDVSILNELPPGRKPVETYAVDTGKRERVYRYIRKHIAQGRQAYIVCPLIEQGEQGSELTAAKEYYETLKKGGLQGISTALLHGQMPQKEKDGVMAAFANGEIKVLISTVVIEVGVDVPNAVLMVIENAERFGLAQLHQLRGRVGRGQHASTCILISDAMGEEATRRLKIMCETTDGFKIAEEDLKMRGPGDFFGSKQHGLPKMRIASLLTDMAVLRQAGDAVKAITAKDPTLSFPENKALKQAVSDLFTITGDTAN